MGHSAEQLSARVSPALMIRDIDALGKQKHLWGRGGRVPINDKQGSHEVWIVEPQMKVGQLLPHVVSSSLASQLYSLMKPSKFLIKVDGAAQISPVIGDVMVDEMTKEEVELVVHCPGSWCCWVVIVMAMETELVFE
jgi:hypothetical protein